MSPQVNVDQLTSTNGLSDVGMSGALSQVTQEYRSGTLTLVKESTIGVGRGSCLSAALAVGIVEMSNIISRVLICVSLGPAGDLLAVDVVVGAIVLLVVVRPGPGIVSAIAAKAATGFSRMSIRSDGALEGRTVVVDFCGDGSGS